MEFKPGDHVTPITEHWDIPMTVERVLVTDYTGPDGANWKALSETIITFKEGGFWRSSQLRLVSERPLFYIQDTRQCVGNSALWWREGGHGYTCNLNEAWKVSDIWKPDRETDVMRRCEDIDALAERHVDVQKLK